MHPLAGDGRAADHDLDLQAAFGSLVDDLLLLDHGGGQQGGEADDVGVDLCGLVQDGRGADVNAQVVDLEAGGGEHGADEGLADLMDVAFDGGEHDHPEDLALGAGLLHLGFEHGDGGFHGFAGHDQFREEGLAAGEGIADGVDAGHVAVGDGVEWGDAVGNGRTGQVGGDLLFAINDALCHLLV